MLSDYPGPDEVLPHPDILVIRSNHYPPTPDISPLKLVVPFDIIWEILQQAFRHWKVKAAAHSSITEKTEVMANHQACLKLRLVCHTFAQAAGFFPLGAMSIEKTRSIAQLFGSLKMSQKTLPPFLNLYTLHLDLPYPAYAELTERAQEAVPYLKALRELSLCQFDGYRAVEGNRWNKVLAIVAEWWKNDLDIPIVALRINDHSSCYGDKVCYSSKSYRTNIDNIYRMNCFHQKGICGARTHFFTICISSPIYKSFKSLLQECWYLLLQICQKNRSS